MEPRVVRFSVRFPVFKSASEALIASAIEALLYSSRGSAAARAVLTVRHPEGISRIQVTNVLRCVAIAAAAATATATPRYVSRGHTCTVGVPRSLLTLFILIAVGNSSLAALVIASSSVLVVASSFITVRRHLRRRRCVCLDVFQKICECEKIKKAGKNVQCDDVELM